MKSVLFHAGLLCFGLLIMFWLAGCDRKPTRVEVPPLNPGAIASGAMGAYDTNSDGKIAGDELASAASVVDHPDLPVKLIDKNSDGEITKDEIQARVQQWIDSKVGVLSFHCVVKMNGKPLEGATVKYLPESFMDGAVDEASGTTDATGSAVLAIDQAKLRSDLKGSSVMQSGFYKVEITHPSTNIPAKYNTETILGHEVASDSVGSINVIHELTGG